MQQCVTKIESGRNQRMDDPFSGRARQIFAYKPNVAQLIPDRFANIRDLGRHSQVGIKNNTEVTTGLRQVDGVPGEGD